MERQDVFYDAAAKFCLEVRRI